MVNGRAAAALLLPMLTVCAHNPAPPPPGMARLVLDCCWLTDRELRAPTDAVCERPVPTARVTLDGADRGTCAEWAGGRLVGAGQHLISVDVSDYLSEEGSCCGRGEGYVILRAGEVRRELIDVRIISDPPDG